MRRNTVKNLNTRLLLSAETRPEFWAIDSNCFINKNKLIFHKMESYVFKVINDLYFKYSINVVIVYKKSFILNNFIDEHIVKSVYLPYTDVIGYSEMSEIVTELVFKGISKYFIKDDKLNESFTLVRGFDIIKIDKLPDIYNSI